MPVVKYTLARLGLLAISAVVLYPFMRGVLLWIVAIIVALAVSYLALGKLRDSAATYLVERRAQKAIVHQISATETADAEIEDAATGSLQSPGQ